MATSVAHYLPVVVYEGTDASQGEDWVNWLNDYTVDPTILDEENIWRSPPVI